MMLSVLSRLGAAGMVGIRRITIYEPKQHGEKFQGV
jgi:hypothetical protein